jgi:NADH:ubiquinone oxidoreductase subunit 5 (subunit L)/multisubunit Na+/H+ antiporter MnhA subunit
MTLFNVYLGANPTRFIMLFLNLMVIIFMLLSLAVSNLFSRFNVKLICSFFLSLSLIRCLNLFYNLIINYEHFYVINLGSWVNFDNLSIDQVCSIYSTTSMTHVISYLSLFTFFMIILLAANNFIVMFIGWEGVGLSSYLLINFLKIIILLC